MNQNTIRELLKEHTDTLSEEVAQEKALYLNLTCPICFSRGCEKRIYPPKVEVGENGVPVVTVSPFVDGSSLPQGYAHCIHCGTDFDSRSGIILRTEASSIMPVDSDPASKILSPPSDLLQE